MRFLITGAARGIGRGLARNLLGAGHRVLLVDVDAKELEHTAELLRRSHKSNEDFGTCLADVSDPAQVRQAAGAARELFGGALDCLVNNAAYMGAGGVGGTRLEDLSLEEWRRSLEVNLTGPMLMTQACLPLLRASGDGGGCVVHVSSTRARQSEPGNEAYSTTKAGLVGLAQSMAVSLGPEVRCSAVLPGWIDVGDECAEADGRGAAWGQELSGEDHAWHPTGRVGDVGDVARAVLYLAESKGVTGVEMVVDGGVSRKMVYPE